MLLGYNGFTYFGDTEDIILILVNVVVIPSWLGLVNLVYNSHCSNSENETYSIHD
jgi:hypothetical protein